MAFLFLPCVVHCAFPTQHFCVLTERSLCWISHMWPVNFCKKIFYPCAGVFMQICSVMLFRIVLLVIIVTPLVRKVIIFFFWSFSFSCAKQLCMLVNQILDSALAWAIHIIEVWRERCGKQVETAWILHIVLKFSKRSMVFISYFVWIFFCICPFHKKTRLVQSFTFLVSQINVWMCMFD